MSNAQHSLTQSLVLSVKIKYEINILQFKKQNQICLLYKNEIKEKSALMPKN